MAYRFRAKEIEDMKRSILIHCENEEPDRHGLKRSWRLRYCIEGLLMCRRPSKKDAVKLERELWLYKSLTVNDLPSWEGYGE